MAKTGKASPLQPSPAVLSALGSIVVHVEELISPEGHAFDRLELQKLLDSTTVKDWMVEMRKLSLIPLKRD